MKHAYATEASLTLNVADNRLIVEIKDNGIGINTTQNNKFGNGLNTMRERLTKFGSALEIETMNGTKLVFKIGL